jgi:hypothetical protein
MPLRKNLVSGTAKDNKITHLLQPHDLKSMMAVPTGDKKILLLGAQQKPLTKKVILLSTK